jgi:3-deoxy-D-manno-octulosonic-acid transferase
MILNFLYNSAIFCLALFWLPKFLIGRFSGKYRESLGQKLGFGLKNILSSTKPDDLRIWIHSCSMGETKAAGALVAELKKRHPSLSVVVSTITETGHAEAKRVMPFADAFFFLPLDFSWVMRRLVRLVNPSLVILVEAEFWKNFLQETYRFGAPIVLVNGKLSERSHKRFKKLPIFSHPLFKLFTLYCVQTLIYQKRFLDLHVLPQKILVTGNLKTDSVIRTLGSEELESWRKELAIAPNDFVIILASTHEQEEELLLTALQPILKNYTHTKILIAPRHPPRFDKVAELMLKQGLPFYRYSQRVDGKLPMDNPRLILIDTMGQLMSCFQFAAVAIVAGSFIPGIGGHNLFEPASVGVPVLFGKYVFDQQAFADALIEENAGICLSLEELPQTIKRLITDEQERVSLGLRGQQVVNRSRGAVARTADALEKFINV